MKRKAYLLPLILTLLTAVASPAFAQTANLVLTTTSSNARVSSTLTWANPTAASCAATGDSGWITAYNALTRPISGTVTLASVPPPNARSYTLTCTWPGDNQAVVSWTAPTTNTDNSALAKCASQTSTGPCLLKFQVYRSSDPTLASPQMTPVNDRNAVSYTWTGLPAGTSYFGVEVVNGDGVPSAMSNIASKSTTLGASDSETVSLAFPGTTIVTVK
jgi:hypothetical protein